MNKLLKSWKNIYLILIIFFNIIVPTRGQSTYKIPQNTKKILFLGNSITYSGLYVAQVETYLKLKYPKNKYVFFNMGLPSETVSQLSETNHANGRFPRPALQERLNRVLKLTKPDLVFASYGMNDGIFLPFDEGRFLKFKEGIEWLHSEVENSGVKIIHLTPPIFDDRKGKEYAEVLDIYSNWLLSKIKSNNWNVANIHYAMKEYVENKRKLDTTFTLAKDGIHPNDTGHWIMAKELLLYLGESDVEQYANEKDAFDQHKNGQKIDSLIKKRQLIMKDSWLTAAGHKRPEMPVSMPLNIAQKKTKIINKQLKKLLL